jgi:arylsulfatase A-like enzyme
MKSGKGHREFGITRRWFALGLAGAAHGAELPELTIVEGRSGSPVPDTFAASAVRFSRAYQACPDPGTVRTVLLGGRFPHALRQRGLLALSRELSNSIPVLYLAGAPDGSPFERSVRLTMALRHPRLTGGATLDFPVSTIDVVPTLYGLAGAAVPDDAQGRNLAPILLTGRGDRPESVYSEGRIGTSEEWRMVVRGLDKIVFRPNLEVLHLFNLGEDPSEERDLAAEPGYQLRIDELRALAREWMKRTADGMDPSGLRRR